MYSCVLICNFYCLAEPPGPPTNLRVVDSTKTSLTLGWGKPVYDGGAPIIGYVVEMRPKVEGADPEAGWKRCNVAAQVIHTEFTATSLDEKQLYEFRVSAQNQVGLGRPAELKEAVSPKEILGEFSHPLLGCLHTTFICFRLILFHVQNFAFYFFVFQNLLRLSWMQA